MITLNKASEYLGVSKKNLQRFEIVTPMKHEVKGWIVKSRTFKMGSLLIDYVDGKETLQYVQGMPKLHYYEGEEFVDVSINLFDKADGTNILFYPLIKDGEVVEVLAKTRLMPIIQKKWEDLLKKIENVDSYKEAAKETRLSVSCELYGFMNPHSVDYEALDIPLRLDLLTVLDQGKALLTTFADKVAKKHGLSRIERFCVIEKGKLVITDEYMKKYGKFVLPMNKFLPNKFENLNDFLEDYFEEMNKKYSEMTKKQGIITEGVVAHIDFNKKDESFMIKIKAKSVKELHISVACGVKPIFIRKALEKAYENLPNIEDKEEVVKFVVDELLEEFPKDAVYQSIKRIESMYNKFVAKKKLIEKLSGIVEELEEVEGDTSDKMRYFARKYPELKPMSKLVYRILTKQI